MSRMHKAKIPTAPADLSTLENEIAALEVAELVIDVADLREIPVLDAEALLSFPCTGSPTQSPGVPLPRAAPTPVTGVAKSQRTTIRLPPDVLNHFKATAATEGKPYQTLIIAALREHMKPTPAKRRR
jgi:hypothetical protein